MKAWEVRDQFGLDHLTITERPDPRPGPEEVLVRLKGMSLNRRDLMMVLGSYNPRQPLPLIPLSDGVGEIVEVGAGVERWSVGERVAGTLVQGWFARPVPRDPRALRRTLGGPLDGMLTELRVLPADGIVGVPSHLSDVEAATLPCAALTAWSALVSEGGMRPGETLVVQGTGGVALFALQFAKLLGVSVAVLSKSDEKLERARALGADLTINRLEYPAWSAEVKRWTNGFGADHILELGGAETLEESLRAICPGGHVSIIGVLGGGRSELALTPILMRNVRLQGIFVGSRDDFEAMNRAIALHRLRPIVDTIVPFDEGKEAFVKLSTDEHFGKIAVRVG